MLLIEIPYLFVNFHFAHIYLDGPVVDQSKVFAQDRVIFTNTFFTKFIEGIEDGRDYFFISEKEFEEKINSGDFLEYAKVFDHYYGTSNAFVEEKRNEGKHVILVIDTQGAMKLKEKNIGILIFISPPSIDALKQRMLIRNTDSSESIEKRLSWAQKEMKLAHFYQNVLHY